MTTAAIQPIPQEFIESQRIARLLEPVVSRKLIHGEEMMGGWFYVVDCTNNAWRVHESSGKVLASASQWPKTEGQVKENDVEQ